MSCINCCKCALVTLSDGVESVYKKESYLGNVKWYKFDSALRDSVEIIDLADLDILNSVTTFLNSCDGFGVVQPSVEWDGIYL
jgi:hypothetical protein